MRELELTERILRLRTVPMLRALSSSELTPLATSLRPVGFQRGEPLLRQEEAPRSFFLVVHGTVALHRGGRRVGSVCGPGGVGFMSFLARHAGGTSAIAESYVEALEIDAEAMDEVFEDHFSVLLATLRVTAEQLIQGLKVTQPPPPGPATHAFDQLVGARALGLVERIYIVRRIMSFNEVNVNSVASFAKKMVEKRADAGEILWRPGDRSDHSYFIVKGGLSLRWNDGRTVQAVGPGDAVGGVESIVSLPRWNELVIDEPVVLLESARDGFIDLLEDDHAVAIRFLSMLATLVLSTWERRAAEGLLPFEGGAHAALPPEL